MREVLLWLETPPTFLLENIIYCYHLFESIVIVHILGYKYYLRYDEKLGADKSILCEVVLFNVFCPLVLLGDTRFQYNKETH